MNISILPAAEYPQFFHSLLSISLATHPEIEIVAGEFDARQFDAQWFVQQAYMPVDGMRRAQRKRQAEFFAGRYCANQAICRLQHIERAYVIGKGLHGQPLWPASIRGSIAHTDTLAMAAVSQQATALGIDCEPVMGLETAQQTVDWICRQDERQHLVNPDYSYEFLLTLMFSAKESVYKAMYYSVKKILDFDVVKLIDIDFNRQQLNFSLAKNISAKYRVGTIFTTEFFIIKNSLFTVTVNI